MDPMSALQIVLKKSLAEDGLHRGLREAPRRLNPEKLCCAFWRKIAPSGLHQVDPSFVQRSERSLGESAIRGVSRRVGGLVQARRRRPSEKGCEVLVRCRLRLRGGNAGAWRLARILEDCL